MPKFWTALCEKNLHHHTQHPNAHTIIPVIGTLAVMSGVNFFAQRSQKKDLERRGITLR